VRLETSSRHSVIASLMTSAGNQI